MPEIESVRKLDAMLCMAARRANCREVFPVCSPTDPEIGAALDAPRSFRTVCRDFALRIDVNEVSGLRGAEIRCLKVRYPPKPAVRTDPLLSREFIRAWRKSGRGRGRRAEDGAETNSELNKNALIALPVGLRITVTHPSFLFCNYGGRCGHAACAARIKNLVKTGVSP